MDLLWEYGPLTVAEMVQHYDEPRPHFNTVSTMVRSLEKKGFTTHRAEGLSYRYAPTSTVRDIWAELSGIIWTIPTRKPYPSSWRTSASAWRSSRIWSE